MERTQQPEKAEGEMKTIRLQIPVDVPIPKVEILWVTNDELDALEAAFAEESRALGFCSGTFSAFATALIGLLTAGKSLPPMTFSFITAWTLAFGVLTAWFWLTYWQARQKTTETSPGHS